MAVLTANSIGAISPGPMSPIRPSGGLLNRLVAFWKLGEAAGATRLDSRGVYHLTDSTTTGQAAGKVGNAASFLVANTNKLEIASPQADDLSPFRELWSLSVWVRFDDLAANYRIASQNGDSGNEGWRLFLVSSGPTIRFQWSDDGTTNRQLDFTGTPLVTTWHHLVVTKRLSTPNRVKLYFDNGTPSETSPSNPTVFKTTAPFRLGAMEDTESVWLNGRIDALGIWSRILSVADVSRLYNSGNGREFPFE